ncbi:MAG: hypothetical protein QG609_587 [Patescibacteria group bacterium]|nr:hypothetical protein [Patescibacteria group bacterium]
MAFEKTSNEIDYKALLDFKRVETNDDLRGTWCFAVSENYTIFLTASTHQRLFDNYGVDPDQTLTEGYVHFDGDHQIKNIDFKDHGYQPTSGFDASQADLQRLQNAIEEVIREKLVSK